MARTKAKRPNIRARRALATLIAVALILGLIPGVPMGADIAYAENNTNLDIGREIYYSTARTNYMYTNGNIAYCGVPSKKAPPNGTYAKSPISMTTTNENNTYQLKDIAACLWFGYGGPGFDASMWPGTWFNSEAMGEDEYLILTHIVLSDFYNCSSEEALDNTTDEFKSWALNNVLMNNNGNFNANTPQARIYARTGDVPSEFIANCFQLNTGSNTQVILGYMPGGWIDLSKVSANEETTQENGCYSLGNAKYGIFRNNECSDKVAELTTDNSGFAKSDYLQTGTYFIKELEAPKGYALDKRTYRTEVQKGATTRINTNNVYDTPLCNTAQIIVAKLDLETNTGQAQGGASLADAQFTVRYYDGYYSNKDEAEQSGNPKRTWVIRTNEDGHALLDDSCLVSGDAFYRSSEGAAAIPLGTLLIQETKAPEGYHLSDSSVQVRQITAAGTDETNTVYNAPSVADQVFRGDFKFIKARESDQRRMANIPFRITNNTTKESHIVVTDANGQASTSAQWVAHSSNTNANDLAVNENAVDESKLNSSAGVWFGTSNPDNAKGALPFGTYSIEELRVSGNSGLSLIRIPSLTIEEREGYVVDLGTFDNQALAECAISTYAREFETGSKVANADIKTRIVDRVQYSNLDIGEGKAYELHASLIDADTREAITDSQGNPITGFARFVPTQQNGYAEVSLTFDSRNYAGCDVVVYEELIKSETGAVIAEHKDVSDYNQTIHIKEQFLKTYAFDPNDEDKTVTADPEAHITDTVFYRNLCVGEEYELHGTLWLKSDSLNAEETDYAAKPLLDAQDEQYSASKTFIPEYTDGSINLTFECDTSALAGQNVVLFETLYRDGEIIAKHEDISDTDQTVNICEPAIATIVADVLDGDSTVSADGETCVVDTVKYENLIPGRQYTLNGELMLKTRTVSEDNTTTTFVENLLGENGNAVVSKTTFTPENSNGTTQVTFNFDSRTSDGDNIVVYETLLRDDVVVAQDRDPNNENQSFSIHNISAWTYMEDARTNTKQVTADSEAVLKDDVSYADAVIGEEYTAYGILIDPDTGLPVLQYSESDLTSNASTQTESMMRELLAALGISNSENTLAELFEKQTEYPRKFDKDALREILKKYDDIASRLVIASHTFKADKSSGNTTLEYALDARDLEGTRATSCILLVKLSSSEAVCAETDLNSEEQSVLFVTGTIKTMATDSTDGDHNLLNSSEAKILDKISYEGLTPGKEYTLEGVLYDRNTGNPLLIADKQIQASKYFVPAASSGTESVEFTLDATGIADKDIVVYEYLYRRMDTGDDHSEKVLVAMHADIESTDQTVHISGQNIPPAGTGYDKTGDTTGPIIAGIASMLAIALLGTIYGIRQVTARNRRAQAAVERALRGLR
ncbi:VaFE repeat-containing surface-anchored protein [Adlercreutzia sp. ZJ154]|uniref:VaFE repeat-containing surface-anchored protein n=1 Tax=Adlercreutzia sp. ZJ154 TaxID=2709790 RepID=UPI0013EB2151|nr:VaFE repeat-containing surface-anchored protein [Adlercreutzia sp. ZJ154]